MKKFIIIFLIFIFITYVYAGIQEAADLTWSLAENEAGKKVLEAAGQTEDGKQAVTTWKCFTQGTVGCMSALACDDPENKEGCGSFQQVLNNYGIVSSPTVALKGVAFQKAQEAVFESHPELKNIIPSLTLSYQYFIALTSASPKKTIGSFSAIDSITGFAVSEQSCPGVSTEFSAGEMISKDGCVKPIYVRGVTQKEEASFFKLDCESLKSLDRPLFKVQGSGWGFDQNVDLHKITTSGFGTLSVLNNKGETIAIFSNMKRCSSLRLDNNGRIVEVDIIASSSATYNINNVKYNLQKEARIVLDRSGKISLYSPQKGSIGVCSSQDCNFATGKGVVNIFGEVLFDQENKIISSNDKTITLEYLNKKLEFNGEVSLVSDGRFSLKKDSTFKFLAYSGKATDEYLILDLNGDKITGSGISFGDKVEGFGKFYLNFGSNSFDSRSFNTVFSYEQNKKSIIIKNNENNAYIGSLNVNGAYIDLITDPSGNLIYTANGLRFTKSIKEWKKFKKKNEVIGFKNRITDGYLNVNFKTPDELNLQIVSSRILRDKKNSVFFTDESPLNLHSEKVTDLVLERTLSNFQIVEPVLQRKIENKDRLIKFIQEAAESNDIEPGLFAATIMAESNFDESMISSAGAYGLGQLTKETVNELTKCGQGFNFDEVIKNSVTNLKASSFYLNCLSQRLNTDTCDPKVWAAYNVGINKFNKACCGSKDCVCEKPYAFIKDKLPLETKWHVMKVYIYSKKFSGLNLNSC